MADRVTPLIPSMTELQKREKAIDTLRRSVLVPYFDYVECLRVTTSRAVLLESICGGEISRN